MIYLTILKDLQLLLALYCMNTMPPDWLENLLHCCMDKRKVALTQNPQNGTVLFWQKLEFY